MTDYAAAGVDVQQGRAFVEQIKSLVASTQRSEVLGGLGGFSGLFELPPGYQQPVLVSGTDGVGTKLKLAFELEQHTTVGIDLVAMCVNDVLTCGAEPLFFLDYLATGKLSIEQLTQVVAGITDGCRQAGCTLLGGETAEMPGFYQSGEYDLAGFCVGIVEKSKILNGSQVQVGDVAIALPSSGVHSNGYSLVRKNINDGGFSWSDTPEILQGVSLGETLLTPTNIYVKPILNALKSGMKIHSMAHITGGGIPENLPRCLSAGQSVAIHPDTWQIPPIFTWLAEVGNVQPIDMFNTFNMGIGFVVIVPASELDSSLEFFQQQARLSGNTKAIEAWAIGTVIADPAGVIMPWLT